MEHSVKTEVEILKISCRRSRSPDNAKFPYFTLLFCRGRKEIKRAQPLFCSLNILISDILVSVAVLVFLNSPIHAHRGKIPQT